MWVAMLPALVLAPLALLALPREAVPARTVGERMALGDVLARFAGPLGVVFAVSALGAFAQRVYLTLMPIMIAEGGGAEATGAIAISVYLGAQALGTLFGGVMTDRMDRRRLLIGLTLWSIPANLLTFWVAPGSGAALAAAVAAGFLNMAMMPPVVVMAQEMLPARAATSSGIVMGLAWAAGSVGVIGVGILADVVGPRTAALASVPLLFAATALAAHPALAAHARHPEREQR
jgi:FSR family fosmidomycin resistance protein-like MFS transporter